MATPLQPKRFASRPPRPLPRSSSSALEQLEDRRLCSVTVTQGWTGYFTIRGTAAADTINVNVSRSAGTFTVDGVTYAGVQYISVIGGDGDDSINVSGSGSGPVGASITGDAGDDTISRNFDGGIWSGDGDDIINLSNAFRGTADAGAGSDIISVSGDCI